MKTVEEMRKSVLAECEWICPNRDFPANADWGHLMFGYVKYDGDDYEAWFLYVSASIHPISLYARSADQIWIAAYSLLGLSERDADSHWRGVLSEMTRTKEEYIAQLEANNAALVTLLTTMKDNADQNDLDDATFRRWVFDAASYRLAANEKGGANG